MGKLRKSMTLIEILVVIVLIGLLVPSLMGIFLTITNQSYYLTKTQTVLQEGNFALKSMKFTIENSAYYILPNLTPTPICEVAGSEESLSDSICFLDYSSNPFCYYLNNNNISSNSASKNYDLLSANKVTVENLKFECSRTNEFASPILKISFYLKDISQINPVFPTPFLFQTFILLKKR